MKNKSIISRRSAIITGLSAAAGAILQLVVLNLFLLPMEIFYEWGMFLPMKHSVPCLT